MSNVSMSGLRETLEGLANTERDMKKAQRRANLAGVEVVAQELRRQAPYGVVGKYRYEDDTHMRDSVVTSGNRTDKNTGGYYAEAGFPKGVAWRSHFPLGTIRQAPNPYFDRTVTNSASRVNSVMASEISKVLR